MISGLDVLILDLRSTATTREVSAQGVEFMGEICYNLQRSTINKSDLKPCFVRRYNISERFGLRKVAPPTLMRKAAARSGQIK